MTDFEHYLEGYCKKHECTEAEAKTHSIVKEIEEYYQHLYIQSWSSLLHEAFVPIGSSIESSVPLALLKLYSRHPILTHLEPS